MKWMRVFNDTGGVLTRGTWASIEEAVIGSIDPVSGLPKVRAGARERAYLRAVGIVMRDIPDGRIGKVQTQGFFGPIDTSLGVLNHCIWLATGGTHAYDPHEARDIAGVRQASSVQILGKIVVVGNAANGYIWVDPQYEDDLNWNNDNLGEVSRFDSYLSRYVFVAAHDSWIMDAGIVAVNPIPVAAGVGWQFNLFNVTTAQWLLVAARDTTAGFPILNGTWWPLFPDQNLLVNEHDVLQLQMAPIGAVVGLGHVMCMIAWAPMNYPR